MADVMGAFLRGHAAGQAELDHAQQLEQNKLRTMVLKHEIDRMKLDDALRADEITRNRAGLALGQESSDQAEPASPQAMPPSPGPTATTAPPAASEAPTESPAYGPFAKNYQAPPADVNAPAPPAAIADVVQGMVRSGMNGAAAPPMPAAAQSMPAMGRQVVDPSGTLLNLHQDDPVSPDHQPIATPGQGRQNLGDQSHQGMQGAGHVWLPPIRIPELGIDVPGQWFSAKAAREEDSRRAIALKRAEQPLQKTSPGESIYDPYLGKEVYRNTSPKAGGSLQQQYDDAVQRGDQAAADRILGSINATRTRSEFGEFQQIYAEGLGKKTFTELTPQEKAGVIPAYNKSRQDPEMHALLIATRQAALTAAQGKNAAPDQTAIDIGPPNPETANVPSKVHGLTPNAVHQDALVFATTGKMPAMGMGSSTKVQAARAAIQNRASALADAAGVDLPTLQAEYKANSGALSKLVPAYRFTAGAAGTANDNIGLALEQSPKVARTGSPLVNRYVQWANGHELTGNPALTKFETYIYTAAREYAKVTSGSAQSVAGLSDSAAKEAEKLLNAAQTPEAFAAAAGAMQNDMQNVTKNQLKQIGNVSDTIARFLGTATGHPPAAAAAEVGTGAALTFKQEKQANGQILVTAPDGHTGYFATQAAANAAIAKMKAAAGVR